MISQEFTVNVVVTQHNKLSSMVGPSSWLLLPFDFRLLAQTAKNKNTPIFLASMLRQSIRYLNHPFGHSLPPLRLNI